MMKRALLLIGLFVTILNGAMAADAKWAICKTYVNVRQEPSTKSEIIGRLYCGDGVQTEEQKNGWIYCIDLPFEFSHGWVCTGYLTDDCPVYTDSRYQVTGNGRVALRKEVSGKIVGWVRPGDVLKIQWISSEWALTEKGQYIKSEFLERQE